MKMVCRFLIWSILVIAPCLAQSGGLSWFKVTRFSGDWNFYIESFTEESQSPYTSDLYSDEDRYEIGFSLRTEGSILHENFLEYRIEGTYQADKGKHKQAFLETNLDKDSNGHDITFNFFKRKPFHFEIYSNETYGVSQRAFFGTIGTNTSRHGIRFIAKTQFLSFDLDAYRYGSSQEGLESTLREETRDIVDLRMKIFETENQDLRLDYKYVDYQEQVAPIQYSSQIGQIYHVVNYGKDGRSHLISRLHRQQNEGDFNLDLTSLQVGNTYYFNSKLYLINSFNQSDSKNSEFKQTVQTQADSVHHQLFESLFSSVNVEFERQNTSTQKIDKFDRNFQVDYRKKIPRGYLKISFQQGAESSDYRSLSDVTRYEETYEFSNSEIISLSLTGVLSDSIEVWSPDLSRPYSLNIDYSVIESAGIISIVRRPEGAIPEGGKVRVFFDYLSFPDQTVTRNYDSQLFELNFLRFLFVTFQKNNLSHQMESDYATFPFEDRYTREMSYRFESVWAILKYLDKKVDSSITPYQSEQVHANLRGNVFRKLKVALNYTVSESTYPQQAYRFETEARLFDMAIKPFHGANLKATYRQFKYDRMVDGPNQDQHRIEESIILNFDWQFRQFSLNLWYDHILFQYDLSERFRDRYYARIRRRF